MEAVALVAKLNFAMLRSGGVLLVVGAVCDRP
jgi:hypothetical protein